MKTKLLLTAIFTIVIGSLQAAIIYVDQDATGANNGTSWANAYNEIYDAIFNHNDGDVIWVAEGTYVITNLSKETPHEINDELTILGGFNGTESNSTARNWDENVTIITGERGLTTSQYDNQRYFFRLQNLSDQASLKINGCILEQIGNDDNPGIYFQSNGSSFQNQNPSELILRNTIIRNGYGQIYYAPSGSETTMTFENTLIRDHDNDGVLFEFRGTESTNRLVNCTIAQCTQNYGDGFYSLSGASNTIEIHNSIVWANSFTPAWGASAAPNDNEIVTHTISEDVCEDCGLPAYSNLISSNPKFVNAAANNFHLQPLSPGINTGNGAEISGTIVYDLDHNPRVSFGLIDIGCYEETDISVIPGVHFVDIDATGANVGTSWNDAFTSLYDAIDAALPGEQIWVAEGTYFVNSPDNINFERYYIDKDLIIFGGFEGTEYDLVERNWAEHPTTISGEFGDPGDNSDNADIIMQIDGATVYMDGFIMTRAFGYPDSAIQVGTVFYATGNAFLSVANCEITNCNSHNNGVTYASLGNVSFTNCLIHNNIGIGGIMRASIGGSITFLNCTIAENTVEPGESLIYSTSTSNGFCNFYNSIIANNGGAPLFTAFTQENAENCVITDSDVAGQPGIMLNIDETPPSFVDAANGNFNLLPFSSGIDWGNNVLNESNYDLDYQPRIQFTTIDAGCFESNQIYQSGGVIYVDKDATGSNNGLNWANAFTTLTSALAIAADGDEIWIAEGTYYPTASADATIAFTLAANASIYGGFNGTETMRSERNPVEHEVILSGNIGDLALETDNSKIILDIQGSQLVVSGLTFDGAYNDPAISAATGGALYAHTTSGSITIRRCIFRNNTAFRAPTIFQASQTELVVEGCLMHNNTGNIGIIMSGIFGSNTYINCTVANNNVLGTGAVFYSFGAANLVLQNCVVSDNGSTPPLSTSMTVSASNSLIQNQIADPDFTFTDCVDAPAQFYDIASANFQLVGGSLAIDLGNNAFSSLNTDLAGNERILFGVIDAGAYESLNAVPGVIYVKLNANGLNNGSSWDNAFTDLQDALAIAQPGDQVWVSDHTYRAHGTDRDVSFNVPSDVILIGGFEGTESDPAQRASNAFTTLSGNIGDLSLDSDNTYHIMRVFGNFDLERFIFREANASGAGNTQGAALSGLSNAGTVTNCKFIGNAASSGAVVDFINATASILVSKCLFNYNLNEASGVISIISPFDANIEDCTFEGNDCPTGIVINMSETGSGHHAFRRNIVKTNQVYSSVIAGFSGDSDISNNFFKDNTCPGGIVGMNSHISGNSCFMVNNTVVENNNGSLLAFNGSTGSLLYVYNNIFWGNNPGIQNNSFLGGLQLFNNIVEGGADSFGAFGGVAVNAIAIDPLFNNPTADNYGYSTNSICYDSGVDVAFVGTLDLLGNPRVANGLVDVGAVERQTCNKENSLCSNPLPLTVDANWLYGNNRCAGIDGYPPMSCDVITGENVWYSFVAPNSGAVTFEAIPFIIFDSAADIRAEIYEGACNSLTSLNCFNVDNTGVNMQVTGLMQGQTYRVRIESGVGTSLGFQIRVTEDPTAPCPGDFDNNGQVDASDLLTFLGQFGCTSLCIADLDGDGAVASSDLLIFLSGFGSFCP
ncbi:MAG: hypothetical protein NWR73_08075 [Flavobacteriales bacterium]|nr:hypothetical protein [Flavobacteriales bacterium]